MSDQAKVIATVVTRNRPALLARVLERLAAQTLRPDEILVVDNDSSSETKSVVTEWQKRASNISYLNTHRNGGSGGGQKAALQYAVDHHYDLVYTMDDDCEPLSDALEQACQSWLKLENRENWMVNSLVHNIAAPEKILFPLWDDYVLGQHEPRRAYYHIRDMPEQRIKDGLFIGWACLFVGTLIPTKLIAKIGTPREELFIRGEEMDYLYRALSQGNVATVLKSIILHPSNVGNEPPWKIYYVKRNEIIVGRQYFPTFRTSFAGLLLRYLRYTLLAFAPRDRAMNQAKAAAVWDAYTGRFDRNAFEFESKH